MNDVNYGLLKMLVQSKLDNQGIDPLLPSGVKKYRLVYEFRFANGIVDIYLQRYVESKGKWTAGNKVSRNDLGKYVFLMDETDKSVYKILSSQHNHFFLITPELLYTLQGSDRVFCYQTYSSPAEPLEIVVVKPEMKMTMSSENIRIHLEIKFERKFSSSQFGYYIISLGQINKVGVWKLNDDQIELINLLQGQQPFPIRSARILKSFADRLTDVLDISDNFYDLDSIPEIKGSSKIVIHVTKQRHNTYNLCNVRVYPIEGGKENFRPGQDYAEYISEATGSRSLVCRNIRKERDNFNIFCKKTGLKEGYGTIEAAAFLSLLEFVHNNPDDYAVAWPEGQKIRYGGIMRVNLGNINFNPKTNWFEMQGNIQLANQKISIGELAKIAKTADKDGFVLVDGDMYMKMTDALRKQIENLNTVLIKNNTAISRYHVGKLAEILNSGELGNSTNQVYKGLLSTMQEAYSADYPIPDGLNATLRDYQKEGFKWMSRLIAWEAGACLADDMGLGKTVQAIAVLLSKSGNGPSLVVAPKSLVYNWKEEIERFAPGLSPLVITDKNELMTGWKDYKEGTVVICTYGFLTSNGEDITKGDWNIVCLDEAHQIKNRATKVSKVVMDLKCKGRIILTGTPVQNNLSELWNLFQFINPGLLGPYNDFHNTFASNDEQKEKLRSTVQPFILRRTKEQVMSDLPVKLEVDYMVQMNDAELFRYEEWRSKVEASLLDSDFNDVNVSVLASLTKLRMASCSIALQEPNWELASSKTSELMRIVKAITKEDNSILIFSQFTSYLDEIRNHLSSEGFTCCYLDGSTSLKERQKVLNEFQNGQQKIFLVSLKAGGVGLNLTAANYVILTDPWWNPAIESQAMDRAHRIGQERDVTVIRMISSNTIEEKILALHSHKRQLSDDIMIGTASSHKLTYEDVLELVSPSGK